MLSPGSPEPAAFLGSERGEHEHVQGRSVGTGAVAADQVSAVRWTERPRELELAEAKQRGDRRRLTGGPAARADRWRLSRGPAPQADRRGASRAGYCPAVLIAYLLGAIGTIGSVIWLMWLISWVHCCGWRMLAT